MSLEDRLRDLAKRGELKHLLITKTLGGYQASYQKPNGSYSVDIRADPIDALLCATGAVPVLEMNARDKAQKLLEMMG